VKKKKKKETSNIPYTLFCTAFRAMCILTHLKQAICKNRLLTSNS
jgi:hypothetical protein